MQKCNCIFFLMLIVALLDLTKTIAHPFIFSYQRHSIILGHRHQWRGQAQVRGKSVFLPKWSIPMLKIQHKHDLVACIKEEGGAVPTKFITQQSTIWESVCGQRMMDGD